MNGLGVILLSQLKRDRWVLTFWLGGIGLLGISVATAITTQFADDAERTAIIQIAAANPAFLFLRGLPDGVSLGAVAFFQGFAFTAVLAGLMSTFLVVRHTRADEEAGRAELLGATPIARSTMLAATLVLGTLANVALVGLLSLAYIGGGLDGGGSVVAAFAVGAVGLVFVGVAALVAQLMPSGRSANGVASALVIGAYLLRGIGDALGTPSDDLLSATPSPISWLSPIGWGQATRPYTEPTLLPLLLSLAVFIVLAGASVAVRSRRDLGSSLVPERSGRASARFGGRSVLGLAWRLQRATVLGWVAGVVVLGAIAGGLGPVVAEAVAENDTLAALIGSLVPGSTADTAEVFIAALLGIGGVLAAAAGVQAMLRLRAEEVEGRAELLLATPVSRARWLGATALVATASVLIVTVALGVATGGVLARSSGDGADVLRYAGAALAHAPAALVFVAIAALAFALVPRVTIALGWGLLVIGLFLGQFGELLQLPGWLQAVSPFFHSSAVPVVEFDVVAAIILLAMTVVGLAVALIALRRRDLTS